MRLLTPSGLAGVAVVRAEPAERVALLAYLRTRGGECLRATVGAPRLATLRIDGVDVDFVLVVDRGENGFELHLHGSPAVLALLRTRFAFDPPEAPCAGAAVGLLQTALCPEQLDLALEQREPAFETWLRECAAMPSAARGAAIAAACERSGAALAMCEPQRLVLVGAQNAGKSTMFNALLGRERVLTGPLPGLTRDPVAEVTTLAGYPYEVVDTAGEGPTATAVDARAIRAGQDLRQGAIALLLVDSGRVPSARDRELAASAALVIATKADIAGAALPADLPCHLRVSCATEGQAALRQRLGERLRRLRGLPPAGRVGGPAALNRRQLEALRAMG